MPGNPGNGPWCCAKGAAIGFVHSSWEFWRRLWSRICPHTPSPSLPVNNICNLVVLLTDPPWIWCPMEEWCPLFVEGDFKEGTQRIVETIVTSGRLLLLFGFRCGKILSIIDEFTQPELRRILAHWEGRALQFANHAKQTVQLMKLWECKNGTNLLFSPAQDWPQSWAHCLRRHVQWHPRTKSVVQPIACNGLTANRPQAVDWESN